jgi:putative SOS response-associated peptidase YedK
MWGRFTHLHLRLQRARNIQVVMCGRYAANRDTGTLTEVFKLKNLPIQLLPENYNISPTSKTYAITVDKNQNRTLEIMTWGLIPSWAKDNSMSAKMINARFETVDEKPSFRSAFSKRRCIIPMDGYYEWFRPEDPKEKKQPYFIKAHSLLWQEFMKFGKTQIQKTLTKKFIVSQ